MPQFESLLRHTLLFFFIEIGVLVLVVSFGIRYVMQDRPNSDGVGAIVCIFCVLICVIVIRNVIPLSLDYLGRDICEVQGVYENLGNNSTSGSSGLGFSSVRITTIDQQILDLTTIPLAENSFPEGEYPVKAYYTQRSKMLVFIEILGAGT